MYKHFKQRHFDITLRHDVAARMFKPFSNRIGVISKKRLTKIRWPNNFKFARIYLGGGGASAPTPTPMTVAHFKTVCVQKQLEYLLENIS